MSSPQISTTNGGDAIAEWVSTANSEMPKADRVWSRTARQTSRVIDLTAQTFLPSRVWLSASRCAPVRELSGQCRKFGEARCAHRPRGVKDCTTRTGMG